MDDSSSLESKRWEKCGRLLCLNNMNTLRRFEQALTTICLNNNNSDKFRRIQTNNNSDLVSCEGAIDTLLCIGWRREDSENLILPVDDDIDLRLRRGLGWVSDTIDGFNNNNDDHNDKEVCEVRLQLRLKISGRPLLTAGFMSGESLLEVKKFVEERWTGLCLWTLQSGGRMVKLSEEDLQTRSLRDIDLCGRAVVWVGGDDRTATTTTTTAPVDPVVQEKKKVSDKQREAKLERQKILSAFRDDRDK